MKIEKLVYGGDGLTRLDGQVALVPFVLPGEEVEAEVNRAKNDLLRGRLVEIRTPSAERVSPPCPYYYRCGGCHYQHAAYDFQVQQKLSILREVLRRVGKIEYGGEIQVVQGAPWQYRNRTQLHIDKGAVGYFEIGSHQLCPVDQCPISSPKLNEVIGLLAREMPKLPHCTTELELFTNETDVQFRSTERVPAALRSLLDSIGTTAPVEYDGFRVSRNSFFQVNRFLIGQLVEAALGPAEGTAALDLYAGVGLFSRALAERFVQVTAVEASASAHRDLTSNVPGIQHVQGTTEHFLMGLQDRPDLVVADPPRAGLGRQVVTELVRLHPPQLNIVSCDPATLARDLRALLASGYRIGGMTLVDLFPQTFHMEAIVWLR